MRRSYDTSEAAFYGFYIVALCSTGETGRVIVSYINQSAFLKELYENNILLSLGTGFAR